MSKQKFITTLTVQQRKFLIDKVLNVQTNALNKAQNNFLKAVNKEFGTDIDLHSFQIHYFEKIAKPTCSVSGNTIKVTKDDFTIDNVPYDILKKEFQAGRYQVQAYDAECKESIIAEIQWDREQQLLSNLAKKKNAEIKKRKEAYDKYVSSGRDLTKELKNIETKIKQKYQVIIDKIMVAESKEASMLLEEINKLGD